MRLLVGAFVCFGTLQIIAGHALASHPSDQTISPQNAVVEDEHTQRPAYNWLALDASDRSHDGNAADPTEFEQHDRGPVLLPLPAEAWGGLALLALLATFRSLKRARII